MEHGRLDGERHGHDAVAAELGEQRAEAEQVRLAAGGALGADHDVRSAGQEARHGGAVVGAVPGEVHGAADGGDELREAAQAVGHGAHGAVQRDGHVHGVDERPVVAHVELPARRLAGGSEDQRGVLVWERHRDGDASHREGGAQGEPHEHGDGSERRRKEGEAAIVEDERPRVLVPRQWPPLALLLGAHHVHLLARGRQSVVAKKFHGSSGEAHDIIADGALHDLLPRLGRRLAVPFLHESRIVPPQHLHLPRRDDIGHVSLQVLFQERLHHHPRHPAGPHHRRPPTGSARCPPPHGVERLETDVLEEPPRQHGTASAEPRGAEPAEGDEGHRPHGHVAADEGDERIEEEQEEAPEQAAGLDGDQHEVGEEGARGEEQAAVDVDDQRGCVGEPRRGRRPLVDKNVGGVRWRQCGPTATMEEEREEVGEDELVGSRHFSSTMQLDVVVAVLYMPPRHIIVMVQA
ncbi:hypothetical protein ACQJBY_048324 [Aegilops geniculata]